MEGTKKKRGVKPITGKAFTSAEKKQRQRARLGFLLQAAKDSGYTPTTVLLNNQHILALNELSKIQLDGGLDDNIHWMVFVALKEFLEKNSDLIDTPNQDNWPKDPLKLSTVQITAKINFLDWEGIQYGEQIYTKSSK